MKNTLIVLCKIAFWIVFFSNAGLFREFASSVAGSRRLTPEEEMRGNILLHKFYEDKLEGIRNAARHGHDFTPMEYFTILKEENILRDSLKLNGVFSSEMTQIQDILTEQLRHDRYSAFEVEEASRKSGFKDRLVPQQPKSIDWQKLIDWMLHLYLSMIPFVFLLFLIWIWEGKESSVLSLKSPLCLGILIVIHPFYITSLVAKWWIKVSRTTYAEVEVRRRKQNIFSKLSTEERAVINAFAHSNATLKEFFVWIDAFGFKKHSIALAIIAVIIGSIASRLNAESLHHTENTLVKTCVIQADSDTSIDYDVGSSPPIVAIPETFNWIFNPIEPVIVFCKSNFHFLLSNGYPLTREPVPIMH